MENKLFRLQRIKMQLKRFLAVPFVLIALFLFVLNTNQYVAFDCLRLKTTDVLMPVVSIFSKPFYYIRKKMENITNYFNVYEENQRLREENKVLAGWRGIAVKLASDQKELTKLLNYIPVAPGKDYVTRVLADYNSPFSQSVILNAGSNIGVQKGDVLITNKGLYGHVIEVGDSTARALKLTDYFSRLPVLVGENRVLCILTGDNTDRPKLISVPEDASVKEGDYVMTAGVAGVYPSGLAIGQVNRVKADETSVELFETDSNIEFIRVVNFGLKGLISTSEKNIGIINE